MFPSDVLLAHRSRIYYLAGAHDPQIVATSAPKGAMYLQVGPLGGREFRKADNGLTTNWVEDSPAVAGANQTLSNLLSPTNVNQDIIFQVGKTAILPNNTFLLSKDFAGTGTIPLVKVGQDNTIRLGGLTSLTNPADPTSPVNPYDVSPLGAGTKRGFLAWLTSDGSSNQSLRGLQGQVQVTGGDNPTASHRGVYAVAYTDAGNIKTGAVLGGHFSAGHYDGILNTDMTGCWAQAVMSDTASQARYIRGANFYTQQASGNTQEVTGINSNVTFDSPGSTNTLNGTQTGINFVNGTINGWVRGINNYVQMQNTAIQSQALYAQINSVTFSNGIVTGSVVGASQNINVNGAAVSMDRIKGSDNYVNFQAGTVNNDVIGGDFNIDMSSSAVSAQYLQAINGNINISVGSVANSIIGGAFNVNIGGSFVSTNEVTGAFANINIQAGDVTNWITGTNGYIYIGSGFNQGGGITANNGGINIDGGTFNNSLYGGNFYVNLNNAFVSAGSINGSNSEVNWNIGNALYNIIGSRSAANAYTGAGTTSGVWGNSSDAIAQSGIMNELKAYRGYANASGNATINDFSGLALYTEVDAGFTGSINYMSSSLIRYDVRCVIPGISDVHVMQCEVTDNDGTPPNSVFYAHAGGGGARSAANALRAAFMARDDGANPLTTFDKGLDLQIGIPYRTGDVILALGATIKNAVANEIDFGANKLKNLVDGTALQDAATVNQLASAGATFVKLTFTFAALDTYYDLPDVAKNNSISIDWWQGGHLVESIAPDTFDYNVSYTGGAGSKTRVNLEAALQASLNVGDKIIIQYAK